MFDPATKSTGDLRVVGVTLSGLRHGRQLLRLAWIVDVIVVIVGSLLPGDSAPIRALDRLDVSDMIEHFTAYAALAFLPAIHERRRSVVILALALVGLGVLLEFGQLLTATRDFEIGDMLADTAGVVIGALAEWPLRRSVEKRMASERRATTAHSPADFRLLLMSVYGDRSRSRAFQVRRASEHREVRWRLRVHEHLALLRRGREERCSP